MSAIQSAWYRWEHADLILKLRVHPRASRDELIGPHGDRFRVRVSAPPVEGRANQHLIRLFAKAFGVKRGDITLLAGDTGRDKRIRIASPRIFPDQLGAIPHD